MKAQDLSHWEADELPLIEENIKLDREQGRVVMKYPYIRDPNPLTDNRGQAISMTVSLEKRLERQGDLEAYDKEFRSYVSQGVLALVTNKELDEWKGLRNYIGHHGIPQPQQQLRPLL